MTTIIIIKGQVEIFNEMRRRENAGFPPPQCGGLRYTDEKSKLSLQSFFLIHRKVERRMVGHL